MERKTAAVREKEALEATTRLIEREGIGAVTVRKVAEEAGMSAGSLRHIFPTQDDLLVSISLHTMQATEDRVKDVLSHAQENQLNVEDVCVELMKQVLPLTPISRADLLAQLAVMLANPHNPRIIEARKHAADGLDLLCRGVVQRIREVPELTEHDIERADRLSFLLDGLALNMLEENSWTAEKAEKLLRQEIANLKSSKLKRQPITVRLK